MAITIGRRELIAALASAGTWQLVARADLPIDELQSEDQRHDR
jgi:hypothetical protein